MRLNRQFLCVAISVLIALSLDLVVGRQSLASVTPVSAPVVLNVDPTMNVSLDQLRRIYSIVYSYPDDLAGLGYDPVQRTATVYVVASRQTSAETGRALSTIRDEAGKPEADKTWVLMYASAKHSLRELQKIRDDAGTRQPWAAAATEYRTMDYVDATSNTVVLGTTTITPSLQSAAQQTFGDAVRLVLINGGSQVSREIDWIPWKGGDQINYGSCTSGFSAFDTIALVHGETGAGHCSQAAGQQITQGCSNCTQQVMGQVAYRTNGGAALTDFEFVDSSYTGSDSDFRVYSTLSDLRTVVSVLTDPGILGYSICTSGAQTLENCNAIVGQTDICFQYLNGPRVCHLDMASSTNGSSLVRPGDSGGPVYRLNPDPFVQALGVISGCVFETGHSECNNGSRTVLFTPFAFTPSRYQIMTSASPGPPVPSSRPVLSPNQILYHDQALASANGAYSLIMQGDGNLVLYGPSGYLWASWTFSPLFANLWICVPMDGWRRQSRDLFAVRQSFVVDQHPR